MKLTDEEARVVKELKGQLGCDSELGHGALLAIIGGLTAQSPTRLLTEGQDEVAAIQAQHDDDEKCRPFGNWRTDQIVDALCTAHENRATLLRILKSTNGLLEEYKLRERIDAARPEMDAMIQEDLSDGGIVSQFAKSQVPRAPVVDERALAKHLQGFRVQDYQNENETVAITNYDANRLAAAVVTSGLLHPAPTREEIDEVVTNAFARGDGGIIDSVSMVDALDDLISGRVK